MSKADEFLQLANDHLVDFHGDSVVYRPLNDSDGDKTIRWIPLRETRYRRQSSAAPSLRYEVMDCFIRAENDAAGHVDPTIWGQGLTEGDTIVDGEGEDADVWYVRKVVERNVGGMHKLRLASTPALLQGDWA